MIAAVSSRGRIWMTVNEGSNNSETVWCFMLKLIKVLHAENPHWRSTTRFLLDNATYHRSKVMMERYSEYQVPIMFLGPYSFNTAPVEKVFAQIKSGDLNTRKIVYKNRIDRRHRIQQLVKTIREVNFGDVKGYFRSAILHMHNHFYFDDV